MSDIQYTYAVARIRALEVSLLNSAAVEQLVNCHSYENCLQLLCEKGWGGSDAEGNAEAVLKKEREKTWCIIRELAPDMSIFDVLSYPEQFHNLKAAIKAVCSTEPKAHIFYEDCALSGDELMTIIKEREFAKLPANMSSAAQDAYETLLQTRDGQLCDIIIDKAALDAICEAGRNAGDKIIRDYAESTVAVANIKIAVRSQKTGKSLDFMKRAMAECDSLSISALSQAALNGKEAICDYLAGTGYAEGAEALAESASAFERWCDNRIIQTIRPQKYNAFSVGPLVAYVIARENEIKTVRIILSGKQSGLSDDSIRERVREMYV